ncbi:MAG: protein serine/threonine phosphatase [Bacteroidetes bacterium]|jgi:serine phosphatase RsbU (regulator of sigma subunit)|nr:protein serine/threonine phosphatase [Bacteroidota bacterium]MDF2453215.1 protein serine/threonine phosphatase [Bacteroidota bacterium]
MFLFLAFFLFSINLSHAQQSSKIEEYEKKLQITGDAKTKIEILNRLGELYLRTQPAKARKYCMTALDLSERTNNSQGKVHSSNTIANSFYLEGDYNSSLEYYLKALKVVEELGDKKGIANGLMGIGNIYSAQGNNKLALEYQLKSMKIREELNDKDGIASCYNNIGIIYMDQREFDKALEYQLKSLNLKQEIGDKKGTSSSLGNIGSIYYELGNYPLAMEYQQKAFEIRKELNNKKGMAMSFIDMGNIYEKQGRLADAVQSELKAIAMAKEVGYKSALKGAYLSLSVIYEKMDSTKNALEYYKQFTAIKDSIFNKENSSKLIEMQTRFDTDRKEKEIALLTKGKEIQALQAKQQEFEIEKHKMESLQNKMVSMQRKREVELKGRELQGEKLKNEAKNKEIKIQEVELKNQRIVKNMITGGLLIACLFAIGLFVGIRQKQKANKNLEQKNNEIADAYKIIELSRDQIAEKNKNITDSINYAKRIQQAILPSKEEMDKYLNEYFIFYKPKDIVSGDFYFYAEQNGKIVVAVADCTGHGVPGAFMSMIGNDMLNQIIMEKGITKPAEILNYLNRSMKKALKQESEKSETTDGMDIAICAMDIKSRKVEYAGAMRPLYFVSNEFAKIDGDSTSIGGYTSEDFQFTNHELNLNSGDTFYIFTDGYVDQFGGDKGKKFMTKNFQSLLSTIHERPLVEQQEVLDQTLSNWKQEKEQVDDVLVIGIKV